MKLHPEHGVNPTLPVCFFCGKEKGEVALLGADYKDKAPMHMVINYEPCTSCQAIMEQGITLAEVTDKPNSPAQPAMVPGLYPTGRWAVVSERFVKGIKEEAQRNDLLQKRRGLVSPDVFNLLAKQQLLHAPPEGHA